MAKDIWLIVITDPDGWQALVVVIGLLIQKGAIQVSNNNKPGCLSALVCH